MNRIPPPRPDERKLPHYHCKDVFESPSGTNACHHPPDDWQPRHNIKKCFDDGTLLGDDDAISSFSTIFIVEKEIIKDHLQHLTTLKRKKTCAQRAGWRNASRDNRNASRTMIGTPFVALVKFSNTLRSTCIDQNRWGWYLCLSAAARSTARWYQWQWYGQLFWCGKWQLRWYRYFVFL